MTAHGSHQTPHGAASPQRATVGVHEYELFGPLRGAAKPPGLVPQFPALGLRDATGIPFDAPISRAPFGNCDHPGSTCFSLPGPSGHGYDRALWYSQVEYSNQRQSVQIGNNNPGNDGQQQTGQGPSGPGFIRVIQPPQRNLPGGGQGVHIDQPIGGGSPGTIGQTPQGGIDPSQLLLDLADAGGAGITQPDTATGYMQGQALPGTQAQSPAVGVLVIGAIIAAIYFVVKYHKAIEKKLAVHDES